MNVPGTFCGSLAHTNPQKLLDRLRPQSPPRRTSGGSRRADETVLPESGQKPQRVAHFGAGCELTREERDAGPPTNG